MGVLVIVLAGAYGVAAGLLLPRVAYRLSVDPGEPWQSSCPGGHPLGGRFGGWIGLARCRVSGPARPDGYGPHTGRVTAVSAAVCAAVGAAVGARPEAAVYVGLAPVLLLLALVDLAVHRLPDLLTLPLAATAAAGLGAVAPLPGAGGSWPGAVAGGAGLGAGYLLLFLINPAGIGFGDVKLALALGVALGWYGWGVWAAGAFLGFLYGALYGLGLLLAGRAGRRTAFPFGPFMAGGALTGVLLGGFGA
ncbi:prepilin peptidase [Streptomyces venezuelae]|uniref:Prepilin peptidase n=1 Tax=Streptomyces venezuelae TaxID=54571 RepID=A0A5P2D5A0_STRVZ|nr:prepilin peptidase [Streptomyces venezuelae]QES49913.1 prepilin peptidase [Streptomyces venezuelae]